MHSRKKLFEALTQINGAHQLISNEGMVKNLPETLEDLANETYGKKSMIYVEWTTVENRAAGEKGLKYLGFVVNPGYAPGSRTSEIQVSYFKGNNWDV